jgi:beta-lactamase regulating signal transducer with metallopeptidase domain
LIRHFIRRFIMATLKTIGLCVACTLLITLSLSGPVAGQALTPAQEQEYMDAKEAINAARSAQAEKYATAHLKKASELLGMAESSRPLKDSAPFSQFSRLARTYAELAEATAELKREEETLASTQDELRKVKAEIEQLRTSR